MDPPFCASSDENRQETAMSDKTVLLCAITSQIVE